MSQVALMAHNMKLNAILHSGLMFRRLIGRRYAYGASLDQREYREVERTLKSHCLPECLATEASHSGSVIDCLANSLSNTNVFSTETVNF